MRFLGDGGFSWATGRRQRTWCFGIWPKRELFTFFQASQAQCYLPELVYQHLFSRSKMVPISYTSVNYFTTFGLAWLGEEGQMWSTCLRSWALEAFLLSHQRSGTIWQQGWHRCHARPSPLQWYAISVSPNKSFYWGEQTYVFWGIADRDYCA